jgi:hypothetical protein
LSARVRLSSDFFAAEGGTHSFAHRDDGFIARCWRIVADVNLDAVGDGNSPPAPRLVTV